MNEQLAENNAAAPAGVGEAVPVNLLAAAPGLVLVAVFLRRIPIV